MATAQSIIVQALQQTLSIDSGGSTPPSEDLNAGLTALINLLDYFQLSPQDTVGLREHVYTPTTGDQFVTIGSSHAVLTMTQTGTTVTVTASASHGFSTGIKIVISGAVEDGYNGLQTITVTSDTAFTFESAAGLTTPATGTILAGAQITAPMPQRIEDGSFCRFGGTDYLIGFAPSFDEYSGQPVKTTEGYPSKCFYLQSNTNIGTLYLWPASNGAELHLWVRETPVNGFASMTLTSTLTLPMGLQKVLVDCLAAELMDIFGVQEPEYSRIRIKANNSLRVWKRSNLKVSTLRMPVGVGSYTSNAFTG
jgi:hypothetical protein